MRAEVVRPGDLGPAETARWSEIQEADPALASPFLRPEMAVAIGRLWPDTRVAVLQVGDREDDHEYTLGGVKTQFHTASHRTLANSYELCKQIDRIQIKHFKYLLDKLSAVTTPTGTLLDQGVTVNTNQIGTGPDHSMTNLPYILAGSANGFLAQGKFIDATPNTPNAQLLNTLAAAVGVKTTMGGKSGTIGSLLA